MCGIAGFVHPFASIAFWHTLPGLQLRGRDAFGVVTDQQEVRQLAPAELPKHPSVAITWGLAIARAEPTTEHQRVRDPKRWGPYRYGRWIVVHNGTIANDKELAAAEQHPEPSIDSAILPVVFQREGFTKGVAMLRGSFAILAINIAQPKRLYFARNYLPLVLARDTMHQGWVAASEVKCYPGALTRFESSWKFVEVPAFSQGFVDADAQSLSSL